MNYEHVNNSIAFLAMGSDEWDRAWTALARDTVNRKVAGDRRTATHPETGECWQYMGTHYMRSHGGWVHDFRHRMHPAYGERLVCQIDAYYTP